MEVQSKIREQLAQYREDFGLEDMQRVYCSREENAEYRKMLKNEQPLPQNVYESDNAGEFYTLQSQGLTQEEIEEFIKLKQLKLLNTIKNCVVFFTTLTVIGLIITFLAQMY